MEKSAFETIKDHWEDILSFLKNEYSEIAEVSYNLWISPLKPHHLKITKEENILYLLLPDMSETEEPEITRQQRKEIIINLVSKKYASFISVSIQALTGIRCSLSFITEEKETKQETRLINQTKKNIDPATISNANLNPRYTFDTFVVGKNNNLAHAASLAVAEKPGEIYNPLFIYGGVGLGKTHLMQSVAHFILQNNSDAKIKYVTSEAFTNELIEAIRNKNNFTTTEFREKYRTNDVLLIDDIQFIIGKDRTQEEFFHTFNALHGAKKQIIITSDKPPKELETLEDRLRSRFEWGLTVDIQPPDYETRMAILRKKEELDHINIDNEVIQYIAANVKSNIRELEGSLTKIVAMKKLDPGREINLEMAQDVLKDLIDPNAKPEITPQFIIQVVAEHFNISELDLIGQKRNKEIVFPRQIAMFLCREMTNAPLQQIGACIGGRDHTTIIHGMDKISTELKTKPEIEGTINVLKKKISAQ